MSTRKRISGALLVVALVAVGGYAYADSHGSDPSYRTAVATTGTVERTLAVTGTVASAGRRDLAFGAAGTVKTVLVKHIGGACLSSDPLGCGAPAAAGAAP